MRLPGLHHLTHPNPHLKKEPHSCTAWLIRIQFMDNIMEQMGMVLGPTVINFPGTADRIVPDKQDRKTKPNGPEAQDQPQQLYLDSRSRSALGTWGDKQG